jgi:hypothetical protein
MFTDVYCEVCKFCQPSFETDIALKERWFLMFEFEDEDFTLMESLSLFNGEIEVDKQVLAQGRYLGDGVWVVDLQEDAEPVEIAQPHVSEVS